MCDSRLPGDTNNMRDTKCVRNFDGLPGPEDLGVALDKNTLMCFNSEGGGDFRWAYIGEITDIERLTRNVLITKDQAGNSIIIAFYTPGRGEEVATSLKVGNTILVWKPVRHGFLDGRLGIRVEDITSVTMFPMKLDKLLEFSDTIPGLLAAQKMPEQTCQTCSRKGTDLKCCGRCRLFWYCNANCQKAAWPAGHNKECSILKVGKLQSYLELDFADWTDSDSD